MFIARLLSSQPKKFHRRWVRVHQAPIEWWGEADKMRKKQTTQKLRYNFNGCEHLVVFRCCFFVVVCDDGRIQRRQQTSYTNIGKERKKNAREKKFKLVNRIVSHRNYYLLIETHKLQCVRVRIQWKTMKSEIENSRYAHVYWKCFRFSMVRAYIGVCVGMYSFYTFCWCCCFCCSQTTCCQYMMSNVIFMCKHCTKSSLMRAKRTNNRNKMLNTKRQRLLFLLSSWYGKCLHVQCAPLSDEKWLSLLQFFTFLIASFFLASFFPLVPLHHVCFCVQIVFVAFFCAKKPKKTAENETKTMRSIRSANGWLCLYWTREHSLYTFPILLFFVLYSKQACWEQTRLHMQKHRTAASANHPIHN